MSLRKNLQPILPQNFILFRSVKTLAGKNTSVSHSSIFRKIQTKKSIYDYFIGLKHAQISPYKVKSREKHVSDGFRAKNFFHDIELENIFPKILLNCYFRISRDVKNMNFEIENIKKKFTLAVIVEAFFIKFLH